MNENLKSCPVCGNEIAVTAKICPKCGAKNKSKFYKRPWFIILVIIAILVVALNINSASENFTISVNKNGVTSSIKAKELIEISTDDQLKFNNEYVGATVTFTAKISETEGRTNQANLGKSYVSALVFDVSGTQDITVCLNTDCEFSKGDTVTVTGEISTELYGSVYIDAFASNIE